MIDVEQLVSDDDEKRGKGEEGNEGGHKENTADKKPDYIHVRARRGQATDSHSLAERVSSIQSITVIILYILLQHRPFLLHDC